MIVLLWLMFQGATAPPPSPPKQPVPFSHKQHIAMKLQCKMCHANPDPGETMGLPPSSVCVACHPAIKKDIPWVRVYQIPGYVDFSHRTHLASGATCENCHGHVEQRDVLFRETNISMGACMECHRQHKAPIDCTACHEQK